MPEIKEKPKAGKPKGRRKSAGPPRQAGRLMKEKLVREVDQRKEREPKTAPMLWTRWNRPEFRRG